MNFTEMTESQLLNEFSDSHKDAFGFRPKEYAIVEFCNLSLVERRLKLHKLHSLIASQISNSYGEEYND